MPQYRLYSVTILIMISIHLVNLIVLRIPSNSQQTGTCDISVYIDVFNHIHVDFHIPIVVSFFVSMIIYSNSHLILVSCFLFSIITKSYSVYD